MKIEFIIELFGWAGACFSLYAFYLVSFNKALGSSRKCLQLNMAASLLLIVNTYYHKAYPSMLINIIWAIITLGSLVSQTVSQRNKNTITSITTQ